MTITINILLATIFPVLISLALSSIGANTITPWLNRETSSPFECGFSPSSNARIPFSLRFFLLAVLFLIFDIEIAILLPTPTLTSTPLFNYLLPLFSFTLILLTGLLHEWNEGSLEWSN